MNKLHTASSTASRRKGWLPALDRMYRRLAVMKQVRLERRTLKSLDERMLRDIGVSKPDARREAITGDRARREQREAEELIPMKTTEKASDFDKF